MYKRGQASETDKGTVDTTETASQCAIKKQKKQKEFPSGKITSALPWCANKQAKVWDLIHLIGQDEYFKGLFGKKDPNENTSGKSKTQLFIRLARDLWPEYIGNDADAQELGIRVKNQFMALMKKYKEEAAYLRETGGGVKSKSDSEDWEVYTKMSFYVPATGPCEDTMPEHLNLWNLIPDASEMPLDCQVNGVVITYDNQKSMQMILNEIKINQAVQGVVQPNTGAKGSATSSSIKKGKLPRNDKRGPKPSMFNIKKSQGKSKKSIEDRLMQTLNHAAGLNFRVQQREQLLTTKKLMLDEFREGLITKEEYRDRSKKLDRKVEAIDSTGTSMAVSSDDDSEEEDELSSSSSIVNNNVVEDDRNCNPSAGMQMLSVVIDENPETT
ncbi:hypothetical protein IW261DRAFT_1572854 [Armillaria novae-zelandiae]|uniref:Uncharacterized protein n=1 Tax=Armillaria novae-zelandiae TaxID=153914 RepID=A0AA39NRX3_9AGAR|nr:hypothetical protein IW261DRAFT_1572854 [Armillaria novae-zelandiae]